MLSLLGAVASAVAHKRSIWGSKVLSCIGSMPCSCSVLLEVLGFRMDSYMLVYMHAYALFIIISMHPTARARDLREHVLSEIS